MTLTKHTLVAAGFLVVTTLSVATPAFAQSDSSHKDKGSFRFFGEGKAISRIFDKRGLEGFYGTVASVNGTTLMVNAKTLKNTATTTYSVDTANAKIKKSGSEINLSALTVGDTVVIVGTLDGTSIKASTITAGVVNVEKVKEVKTNISDLIKGTGQPVVVGTVTAVSGTTVTIKNASGVTYAVNAAGSTIVKNGSSKTVSDLAVGDTLVVQGVVNGSTITASSVLTQNATSAGKIKIGFFGGIGKFFSGIFGF